jgi:chemotaxis family two-component system response regulator Rcp1
MSSLALQILLVDDNQADVDLARATLAEGSVATHCHTAGDGLEALAFLRREGAHAAAPRPDLIVLDLNMPRMDGRELLQAIKSDPALKRIPVVVLSTSAARDDIQRSYDLHANCYLRKPVELDQYQELMQLVERFWLQKVHLPQG